LDHAVETGFSIALVSIRLRKKKQSKQVKRVLLNKSLVQLPWLCLWYGIPGIIIKLIFSLPFCIFISKL
jgi:hypothetical protein